MQSNMDNHHSDNFALNDCSYNTLCMHKTR